MENAVNHEDEDACVIFWRTKFKKYSVLIHSGALGRPVARQH